jgi:putative SOS response-associated peptidase YedK
VPGDEVLAVVPGRRLVAMRWGMIPMGRSNARGRPVLQTIVNARGETLFTKSAFAGLGRCLLPVSGWYESTGAGRRRTRWAIRPRAGLAAFAAVWDAWTPPGGGDAVASLATVTCAPNAEVAAVHDRMPAVIAPDGWAVWLGEAPGDPAGLLAPLPDGSFVVEPG